MHVGLVSSSLLKILSKILCESTPVRVFLGYIFYEYIYLYLGLHLKLTVSFFSGVGLYSKQILELDFLFLRQFPFITALLLSGQLEILL